MTPSAAAVEVAGDDVGEAAVVDGEADAVEIDVEAVVVVVVDGVDAVGMV